MSIPADRTLRIGIAITGLLLLVATLSPLLAPYDPRGIVGPSLARPTGAHLLGTNDVGQDLLSQILLGSRVSLATGLMAAGAATALGVGVGTLSGLVRAIDVVAMRVVDVFLAIPGLPLMIVVAVLVGPSRPAIVAVIAMAGWPPIARVVRSQTVSLAHRGFVTAAHGFGATPGHVVRHHLVPGLGPLIGASFVNWAATALVLDAGLAFLGLGDPTGVSWGSILQRGLDQDGIYASSAWMWWVLPAGLAVSLASAGLAFVGVGLEPRANPRLART